MAQYDFDPQAGTVLITLDPTELSLAIRAVSVIGPTALKDLLDNWLKGLKVRFRSDDEAAIKGKVSAATDDQITSVKAALGL